MPGEGQTETATDTTAPAPLGAWGLGLILLGTALRVGLFALGRVPLDGDEAMMGIMAYHLSKLEHFPIYFYGQHYMGTLELPPAALLMALGPAAWKFSVWPIRLTELLYFAGLMMAHWRLCSRFFGARAARWMLFFLAVGPFYWMDYSSRLRHVTLMMLMGEGMMLAAIEIAERLRSGEGIAPLKALSLGVLIGLSLWHYQLIVLFLVPLTCYMGVAIFPRLLQTNKTERKMNWGLLLQALSMGGVAMALAALSFGFGSRGLWRMYPRFYYPHVIAILLASAAAVLAVSWRTWRRPGSEASQFPALVFCGFLAGYAPAIIYLATLRDEFWVSRTDAIFQDLLPRLRDLFFLEIAWILEFTHPIEPGSTLVEITVRTYVYCILYGAAMILFLERFVRPRRREERLGVFFFGSPLAVLLGLHVVTPRPTAISEPRFLVPIFMIISVLLGLAADSISDGIASSSATRFRKTASRIAATLLALFFLWLWGPIWLESPSVKLDWPSGHRRKTMEVVRALAERNIQKVALGYNSTWMLFGYELQYASGMKARFNAGTIADRLKGIVEEKRYAGDTYLLITPTESQRRFLADAGIQPESADEACLRDGFFAGEHYLYRVPPGVKLNDRNMVIKERKQE